MSTNQHKLPKFSTMAGKEVPHLDHYSKSFGQCTLLQEKNIKIASQQLINILIGKINTPRKQLTITRPHPTCSHRTASPCTCQISPLTNKSSSSHTVFNLPADIASDGHTSFHTTLQMVTKHGCKPIPVKIDSGAEINTVPLSKYKKLFPAHVTKSGNLKSKALHPTNNKWAAHNMTPQKFLGYFIADIQHKSQPDIIQVRYFVFKDNTSPQILLSYSTSIRLGIIEFKVPKKVPATALDAITHHKKTCHIQQSIAQPYLCENKKQRSAPYLTTETSYKAEFLPGPSLSRLFFKKQVISGPSSARINISPVFPPIITHYKTIFDQIHHISSVLHKINYSWTIPCKTCHPTIVFPKISYFRTILHPQCYPNNNPLKINHFRTISLLIMFATS